MADLLHNKLLHSLTLHSSRFPFFSFPLSLSSHSSFSTVRFIPLRWSRFSHSSVLAKLSPDSTQFDIISTTEHSDGSVVFKFGDASEISESVENLDSGDANTEILGTSDGKVSVNDTKSELVGRSIDEFDVNDVKSEVLETPGDEYDATDEKLEALRTSDVELDVNDVKSDVVGTFDGDVDVNDAKSEFVGCSDGGLDLNNVKELLETAVDEYDASDEKPEVRGTVDVTLDGGIDARNEKLEIQGTPDSKHYARDENSEVVGTPDGDNDLNDMKSEFVVRSDVELNLNDVKEVLETSCDEYDASNEKPEVRGTFDVKLEVLGTSDGGTDDRNEKLEIQGTIDVKLEVIGTSDSETDARNEKLEIQETPDSKHYVMDEKLEVVGTPDGDVDVNDTESEFLGRSDVGLDLNEVKEVLESPGGEYDASYEKPEAQGTIDVKLEVIGTSDGESEARNEKLEIQRTPDSKHYDSDEKSEVVGTSSGEDDAGVANLKVIEDADDASDEKSEVVGSSDGEHDSSSEKSMVIVNSVVGLDASDAKLEVLEASNGEFNIHDEKSKIVGTSTGELDADGAKLEVLETLDGENNVSDAKSELLGISNGEHEVKLGQESISDAELPKVNDSEGTEVEQAINVKPDSGETAVESIVQMMELVGSMGITNESFTNSVADSQSAVQSNADSNVLSDKGDSVELMPKPTHVEAEPINDEEAILDSVDNSVALESVLGVNMGDDAALSTIAQLDDDPWSGDVLEAVGPEASGVTLAETNIHSDKGMEVSPSALCISSAAVSLPHPSEALTGGEDAYFVCQNWFGVADGVGQWSLEGITKGFYAQELMQNCEMLASNSQNAGLTNIKEVLQQSTAMTQSTGSARVLIANFDNEVLHVANIGDSGFVIIRNGAVLKKSSPMVHEFNFPCAISLGDDPLEAAEEYHVELKEGDVVITATDGLFDNLYEEEIAFIVSKSMGAGLEPKEIAKLLAMEAQEVGKSASARSPFADAAHTAGHTGYIGGKLDHVTVIVSLVQI